jgi:RNA polymerase sigma factor (sigma-70 family)
MSIRIGSARAASSSSGQAAIEGTNEGRAPAAPVEGRDQEVQDVVDAFWACGDRNQATLVVLEKWGGALQRVVSRQGLTETETEEVVFDAVFKVLRKHDGQRYRRLKQVLFKAAKRRAWNCKRDRRVATCPLDDGRLPNGRELEDERDSLETKAVSAEESRRIRAVIEALREPYKSTVLLRYYSDPPLTVQQVAIEMKMRKRTVEKKLEQAHERVQQALRLDRAA